MNARVIPLFVAALAAAIFAGNWWVVRSAGGCTTPSEPCKCVVTVSGFSSYAGSTTVASCSVKLSLGNFTASQLSDCDIVEPGWFDRIVMCDSGLEATLTCGGGKKFTVSGNSATRFSCGEDEYGNDAMVTSDYPWTSTVPQNKKPRFGGGDEWFRPLRRALGTDEPPARGLLVTGTEQVTVIDGDAGVEPDGGSKRVLVAAGEAVVESFCGGTVTHLAAPAVMRLETGFNYLAHLGDPTARDHLPDCTVKDLTGKWRGGYTRQLKDHTLEAAPVTVDLTGGDGGSGTVQLQDARLTVTEMRVSGSSLTLRAAAPGREFRASARFNKGGMTFDATEIVIPDKGYPVYGYGKGSAERLYIAQWAVPYAGVNSPYSHRLVAYPREEGMAWRVAEGQLPDGITLDPATGILGGTPTAAGSFRFVVEAANPGGDTFQQPFWLTVKNLLVTTTVLPDGLPGQPYKTRLEAVGGQPPYQWRSLLPPAPGFELDSSTGEISVASMPQMAQMMMGQVTDSQGASELYMLAIDVRKLMILGSHFLPEATAGEPFTYRFEAAAGGAVEWSIQPDLAPAGLHFDPATGELAGTPPAAGTTRLTITARSGSNTVSRDFLFTARNPDGSVPQGASCAACPGRRR